MSNYFSATSANEVMFYDDLETSRTTDLQGASKDTNH